MRNTCLVLQQPCFGAGSWSFRRSESSCPSSNSSQTSLWRPWLPRRRDGPERCPESRPSCPYSRPTAAGCALSDGKPQAFQHPVRLFWPKSKSFDYLYSDGEALLRNFPIQATISFYEESDSEDENEEEGDGDSEDCFIQQPHDTSNN